MNTKAIEHVLVADLWTEGREKAIFDILKPEYLEDSQAKNIFIKAEETFQELGKLNFETAYYKLDPQELSAIMEAMPRILDGFFIQRIALLKRNYEQKRLSFLAEQIAKEPNVENISKLQEFKNELSKTDKKLKDVSLDSRQTLSKAKKDQKEENIFCGFASIDRLIAGFGKGELCTVGSRPGEGKTSFLCRISLNIAEKGHKVLFFTTEMLADDILLSRMFPMESGIDAMKFRMKEIDPYLNFLETKILPEFEKMKMFIDDSAAPSLEDIEARLEKISPDILFIDYLQRCSCPRSDSRYLEITRMMTGLKNLANKYRIPIIIASQLGRDVERRSENAMPKLSDLRESGGIEQESDIVILFCEDKKLSNSAMKYITAITAKNRRGPSEIVNLNLERRTTNITESANSAPPMKSSWAHDQSLNDTATYPPGPDKSQDQTDSLDFPI